MNSNDLPSNSKEQVRKQGRVSIPLRLISDDHKELKESSKKQQRSMSFVAMRRYSIGRAQELMNDESLINNNILDI